MKDLEEFAKKVAGSFSREYRTARNPCGKKRIIVYGGGVELRQSFSHMVRGLLPIGVDAYVFGQENKISPRERGEDPDAFYVDFNARCLSG